jgi:uncharacterized membrane protein
MTEFNRALTKGIILGIPIAIVFWVVVLVIALVVDSDHHYE